MNLRDSEEIWGSTSPNPYPGCEEFIFRSDEYWECYIKSTLRNYAHSIGTCRMGRLDDERSIVDSKLRYTCEVLLNYLDVLL